MLRNMIGNLGERDGKSACKCSKQQHNPKCVYILQNIGVIEKTRQKKPENRREKKNIA